LGVFFFSQDCDFSVSWPFLYLCLSLKISCFLHALSRQADKTKSPKFGNWLCLALNWLCFIADPADQNLHKLLSLQNICNSNLSKIGFVFSNWVFNPQKIWGLNKIGFVWL